VHLKKIYLATCIGNLLEHYDLALFGLTAHILSNLFFPHCGPADALMYTYAIFFIGLISAPVGSMVFGLIGDYRGRKEALILSIIGTAIATGAIAFIPTYKDCGLLAPSLLLLCRLLQGFFAAGESAGGVIVLLEESEEKNRSFLSSCFDSSTVLGVLFCSLIVTIFSKANWLDDHWRILYGIGSLVAIFGAVFRNYLPDQDKKPQMISSQAPLTPFICIFFASALSYTTYNISFTLMTGYVPLISSIPSKYLVESNTILLFIDLCLLPIFGYICFHIKREWVMLLSTFLLSILSIPLFYLLNTPTPAKIFLLRLSLIILGSAFAAPLYAWATSLTETKWRYRTLALATTFGGLFIGKPTSFVCLWIYNITKWVYAPGVYLLVVSLAAFFSILYSLKFQKKIIQNL